MVLIIIFKLLNFAVFCTLTWYAVVNYLLPYARTAMQEYDNFLIQLLTQKRHFKEQKNDVCANMHQQELFFLEIEKKFALWRVALEKQKTIIDKQKCELEYNLQIVTQQRLYNLQTKLAQKQMFPEIIQQAEHEIATYYESLSAQDRYNSVIFAKIKRKSS